MNTEFIITSRSLQRCANTCFGGLWLLIFTLNLLPSLVWHLQCPESNNWHSGVNLLAMTRQECGERLPGIKISLSRKQPLSPSLQFVSSAKLCIKRWCFYHLRSIAWEREGEGTGAGEGDSCLPLLAQSSAQSCARSPQLLGSHCL